MTEKISVDDAINEYYDLKQQYKVSKDKEIQTFLDNCKPYYHISKQK